MKQNKGTNENDQFIIDKITLRNVKSKGTWKALINDVETGIIDVVMTKDLSRLGRNYIEAGYYTEEYFPEKGVRFIALNDNYDSEKEDNDLTPFMNIINQWYLKDLSKKVKQSNHNRMKKGLLPKNISIPFYGFKLNDKNERVICEETARVVRKIFELYLTSKSPVKIVQYLFEKLAPQLRIAMAEARNARH